MRYVVTRMDSSHTVKEIIADYIDLGGFTGFVIFKKENDDIVAMMNQVIVKEIDIYDE